MAIKLKNSVVNLKLFIPDPDLDSDPAATFKSSGSGPFSVSIVIGLVKDDFKRNNQPNFLLN